MKCVLAILACITLLSTGLFAQQYFPAHAFDNDDKSNKFLVDWYSGQLKALDEPSMWELSQKSKRQVYRFLYLRSFHHPISVRLQIQPDGSGVLTVKIADGAGGYAPGKLIENRTEQINETRTKSFLQDVDNLKYWSLPSKEQDSGGTDGSEWIVEGARHGQYKIVVRWSPENGPIRALGLQMLIDLADVPLLYKEVY